MQRSGTDLQLQTLQLYGELRARSANWAGRLVFAHGAGATATGLPAAVSMAGGTSLLLDPDAAVVKRVFRQGGVDFVVNTLDEALRVLKNEIRKHRPLSVVLEGDIQPAIEEMRARGVLPDLQVSWNGEVGTSGVNGADHLDLAADGQPGGPTHELAAWLHTRQWLSVVLECATTAQLRQLDARLLSLLPEGDELRRTWLQRIAHYQRPAPGGARVVWLTEAERAEL